MSSVGGDLMPRRNHRAAAPRPESVADLGIPKPRDGKVYRLETRQERDERLNAEWRATRDRTDARTDVRVKEALDWGVCCIPGCGADPTKPAWLRNQPRAKATAPPPAEWVERDRDVSKKLPLCKRHEVIVANMVMPHMGREIYMQVREKMARQYVEADLAREALYVLDEENNGHAGQLYFVRINGMIKVGWSSALRKRLKSYGASAEILCHYPGSRQDETLLHRQLRPFLARGREWYQDCPLLADVVKQAIALHGEPTIIPFWTEPKAPLDARPKGWANKAG